jgi:hypothetical protein
MLKSILAVSILVALIPTVGYIAAGQVCLLMGLANIPGYKLWRFGVQEQRNVLKSLGLVLGWLGQSVVSISFAFLLVRLIQLYFGQFELHAIIRWPIWFAVFFLALGPTFRTFNVSGWSSPEIERRYLQATLPLTALTTAIVFVVLAAIPFGFL